MINRLLTLILVFTFSAVYGDTDEQPLLVKLHTQETLLPVAVGNIEGQSDSLSESYLNQLRSVIQFDFNFNGMTKILNNASITQLVNTSTYDTPGDLQKWKATGAYYLIQGKVNDRSLTLRLLSLSSGKAKTMQGIQLTGDLSNDRKVIHQLHDQFHAELFNSPGVASTRFLYAKRIPQGKDGISEIWECDWDGGNDMQITRDGGYCVSPLYLPPKEGYRSGSFFYVSYRNGQPKIYVAGLSDGVGRRLTYLRGNQMTPAVSATRDAIAFISDVTGNPDLFLQPFQSEVGAMGKPRQIFTAPQAAQGSPTFSPDGKRIAFVSNKSGSPKIYVIPIPRPGTRLRDMNPQLISKVNRENTAPSWSPDGTKIAFCARTSGDRQIWVADLTTGEEKQITDGPGNKENPSWAPNSLHLVFNRVENDRSELYLVNLNQQQAVKISNGIGEKRFPCWEPRLGG